MSEASDGIHRLLLRAGGMLLDFDGVLADSEPFFRRSWNAALEPWGHSIGERDYWNYWSSRGEGLEGEIRRSGLDSIDRNLVSRRQEEIYAEFVLSGAIPLFPGASLLLEELESGPFWGGRPYCIASNTPASQIRHVLKNAGAPVPEVVGGDGLEKKPSPAIFMKAASILGIRPSETVVLEDSWKGITAAGRGGFRSLLVINRYNRDLDIGGEFRISGLDPLLKHLSRNWNGFRGG
ncbi:MAG: HAD family phosphatase [Candidatus Fermentibacteraceae bacterium]|nr:HAD family phosphatase [Candidatus Fermentibacteraceae bacterium]MBN2609568.1 HAD family phosphatase [Candidatus Fermentibacteraceae bacterium]